MSKRQEIESQAETLLRRIHTEGASLDLLREIGKFEARNEFQLPAFSLAPDLFRVEDLDRLLGDFPESRSLQGHLVRAFRSAPIANTTVGWCGEDGKLRLSLGDPSVEFVVEPEAGDFRQAGFSVGLQTWTLAREPWVELKKSIHYGIGLVRRIDEQYFSEGNVTRALKWDSARGAYRSYLSYSTEFFRDIDYTLYLSFRPSSGELELVQQIVSD